MKKNISIIIVFLALHVIGIHAQEKQIYIPEELRSNDFTNDESQWSYSRMAQTPNVVCFWEKGFGQDLSKAPELEGHKMTVDLPNLLSRIEFFYQVYRDIMRFTLPGSKSERYKMMVMLQYSLEGTAFGGSYDNTIGALWVAPNRVQDRRLNCIAHELGHSFQIQVSCDGQGHGIGGGFFETASQWMLWNVNPEWPTDENYHWKAYIEDANLPFLDGRNIYRAPYVLEYWSMKRGMTVIANLFRQCRRDEDAAIAYMRMFNLTVEEFAREIVDCYSRLITFDFPGKHEMNKQYTGEFLNDKPLGTFGANVMEIEKGENGKRQDVLFKGEKGSHYAYRLVAINGDADATYSDIVTASKGTVSLRLPSDATHVYLVVTAYPQDGYTPNSSQTFSYQYKKK
ncbi:MAG: hypothetical protein J6V92_08255 [Bacteroidaceae bacterium]|nr:hypothetical protein [Bacteroidaceae bacterium]